MKKKTAGDSTDEEAEEKLVPKDKAGGTKGEDGENDEKPGMSKKKKIIIIASIVLVLVVALTVTLVLVLKKKDNPTPDPPAVNNNPYYLSQSQLSDFGKQTYIILRDQSQNNFKSGIQETASNTFMNNVTMTAGLSSYSAVRLSIGDSNSTNNFNVNDETYLSQSYLNQQSDALRFNQIGFSVGQDSTEVLQQSNGNNPFIMKLFDKTTGKVYFTTKNQDFYAMSHYLEFAFTIQAQSFFGIGERSSDFQYTEGTYTLFPYVGDESFDEGQGGKELYGQHPLIVAQMNDGTFFGIFNFNSNAQQITFTPYSDNTTGVSILAVGGVLDMFYFIGPTYDLVLQQYHQLIGKPTLLPIWAHGYQVRSSDFIDNASIQSTVNYLQSIFFPIETIGIPADVLGDQINFNLTNIQVATLQADFPGIKFIMPFTYFVNQETLKPADIANIQKNHYVVTVNGSSLEVMINNNTGYCLDFFNPNIGNYLQPLLSTLDTTFTGYWLEMNIPVINSSNATDGASINPFYSIPFVPGKSNKGPLSQSTIPMHAQHVVDTSGVEPEMEYHFNLHGLHGTQMAIQFINNLPAGNPFVISDSTFPGAGQYGIAHVLPRNNMSWDDLPKQVSNLLNFNMFGIPNVGSYLCGYDYDADLESLDLCARYFQIAVVSPLAVSSYDTSQQPTVASRKSVSQEPEPEITPIQGMIDSLSQRLQFMVYMRTELYKIQQNGGAFLKPMIAAFPNDANIDPNDVSSIMYGDSIKVDFTFTEETQSRFSYFPGKNWLDLNTLNVVNLTTSNNVTIQTELGFVNMYQAGNGTVVAYQNTTSNLALTQVSQMNSYPISLSIYLDDSLFNAATGHVFLEEGLESNGVTQFIEVKAQQGIITFNQQNAGTCKTSKSTNIERIIITNANAPIVGACALLKDFVTVQPLFLSNNNSAYGQAFITPNDPTKPADVTTINLNDIAYVFYGNLSGTQKCDSTLFQMSVIQTVHSDDFSYQFKLQQNIQSLFPVEAINIYLNITLLTDNSVYFFYSSAKNGGHETPTAVYDRNFTTNDPDTRTHKLADVFTFNPSPFYFKINQFGNAAKILYSTQNQLSLFHEDMNIFSAQYPSSDSDKFFGLGERKGQFFLQDNYTYSLFANSNNAPRTQSGSRITEYGTNGFFPVVFSRLTGLSTLTCVWTITSTGQDFIYNKNTLSTKIPTLTQVQPNTLLEQVLIFDLSPTQTTVALHNHVQFGSLFTQIAPIRLPPPEFSFGQFVATNSIDSISDIEFIINKYQNTILFPLEGFYLNINDLQYYQSFTFNNTKYGNGTDLPELLDSFEGALIMVSKSGIPFALNNTYTQQIMDNKMFISDPSPSFTKIPFTGRDQEGDLYYVDYSVDTEPVLLLSSYLRDFLDTYFKGKFDDNRGVGIHLTNNEITNTLCNGDCYVDNQNQIMDNLLFKPGNNLMLSQTLSNTAKRAMGDENTVHNLNGLIESIQYLNLMAFPIGPVISDSTAVGTGKTGFVGRILDNFHFESSEIALAVQTIQAQSIMGMSMMGLQSNFKDMPDASSTNPFTAVAKFSAFLPLSVQQLTDKYTKDDTNLFTIVKYQLLRYMMLKYTRTQIFIQSNFGNPFIRPIFYDFPANVAAYQLTDKQYFYGPSFIVSISNATSTEPAAYFPTGTYCSPNITGVVDCYYMSNAGMSQQPESFVYLRQGTITPLQSQQPTIKQGFNNTNTLEKIPTDLHILYDFNQTTPIATGQLLIEGDTNEGLDFCFITYTATGAHLVAVDSSASMGGSGQCAQYQGFTLGDILLYNSNDLTYKTAVVNGVVASPITGVANGNYMTFPTASLNIHLAKVLTIDFS